METRLKDPYQFHDNKIHGISLITEAEHFRSELHLDIDYIIRWPDCVDDNESKTFLVSRALLRFVEVTDLAIHIDWGQNNYANAAIDLFIDRIEQEKMAANLRLPGYYHWKLFMSDPLSTIAFGAADMFLDLIGKPISVERQYLTESERINRQENVAISLL